jgi:hypothetical protein
MQDPAGLTPEVNEVGIGRNSSLRPSCCLNRRKVGGRQKTHLFLVLIYQALGMISEIDGQ